ncbi:ATP-binding cassette domain-containing protein [Saccharomonospora azurea]|uniref:ABC transporter ATP-binding protein n=1 Tax=Saccharomonospora azurea TaxID=40988 RepID=UPI003D8FD819
MVATSTSSGVSAALAVSDIRKHYGDVRAVDGVSFEVVEGEFFGILGPNGAGKTTTLEIAEGLLEPDSGTVRLLGQSPWPRNESLLPRIGVQLQASSFFERLTAREQLTTFAALYGVGPARADEMLELVGLADKADTPEKKLSGGQRQRLSIACALVHDPELVFLDEPTAALDPQARRNLWDVLREIKARGSTIVYTTHYLDEAEVLCDRVAIMDHGRILALDTPGRLVRDLDAPTHLTLDTGVLVPADAHALPGADSVTTDDVTVTISTRTPAPLLTALAERGTVDGLTVRTATLEDVFLHLTGREYRA